MFVQGFIHLIEVIVDVEFDLFFAESAEGFGPIGEPMLKIQGV